MEKLVYLVAKADAVSAEVFSDTLRRALAESLLASGAHKLQINVVDGAVAPAAHLRQINSSAAFDGVVSLWIDSAFHHKAIESVLRTYVARFAGYVVTESERIPNTAQRVAAGERTPGFSQVCTLQVPPRLTYQAWFDYWQQVHGTLAIETQSTFRYVQNIVVRRLNYDAPPIDAIIEECFPAAAMTDPQAFFAAVGDLEKYQKNLQRMIDSCQQFIDFDKMDVIITSEYVVKQ